MCFENNLFNSVLSISSSSYGNVKLYYEDRYVQDLYLPFLDGIIIPKNGKITLREPDRESYKRDEKWYRINDKIMCKKTL